MARSRQDLRRGIEALAYQQAGYFSAAQALANGYTYQAQKYHADSGNWVRVDRGLFRLPHWPSEPDDQYVLWTLWSDNRGVVSHDSALRHHGLSDIDPDRVHLSVPPGFGARDPMVVTHVNDLPDIDVVPQRGWRVTTPLRTLADVSASMLSQELVDAAVAGALATGLVTRRAVLRRSAELADRGALRLERALSSALEPHGDE
jgi:predicted transcriptional regulator of viral defense system